MSAILTDLYYGRISPWERRPTRSAESREIDRKIEDEKRYFIQKMSLDDCQRFQEPPSTARASTGRTRPDDIWPYQGHSRTGDICKSHRPCRDTTCRVSRLPPTSVDTGAGVGKGRPYLVQVRLNYPPRSVWLPACLLLAALAVAVGRLWAVWTALALAFRGKLGRSGDADCRTSLRAGAQ